MDVVIVMSAHWFVDRCFEAWNLAFWPPPSWIVAAAILDCGCRHLGLWLPPSWIVVLF